jgi:tetratricopeptide (TPR) repeat protein
MLIRATLVSMMVTLLSMPAGQAGAPPPSSDVRTICLSPPETGKLDPALAAVLPGLVAAALESGGRYQVTRAREGAGWILDLRVSGRGPWQIAARITPAAEAVAGSRVKIGKIGFAGRDDLTRAVDDLTAQLDAQWSATDPSAGAGEHPVPLARALSPSTAAVDAYLKARSALRSSDASVSPALLDQALAADPSFVLAAAHRARLHLASGEIAEARAVVDKMRQGRGTAGSPLSDEISTCLALVLRGPVDRALDQADAMIERSPQVIWARTLRALALGGLGRHSEAVPEWMQVVMAQPDDPASRALLGYARMAMGDFLPAAEDLARARQIWPSNLILYTLQAECLARLRDTGGARAAISAMRDFFAAHDLVVSADALNPFLLLGSVDLLEGKFAHALKQFEEAADMKSKSGASVGPTDSLLQTIVEMRRDLVSSRDKVTRSLQIEDAKKALDRYEGSLLAGERKSRELELQRLMGLIMVKEHDTVAAWKQVDQMRSRAGEPNYSAYDEAYLSAATARMEDDLEGVLTHFERAAEARGMLVDFMDLGQIQLVLRKYTEARASLERIEQDLASYAPAQAGGQARAEHSDLILADPHIAAMWPLYQYVRARLAYETGNATESRRYFDRLLKYFQKPDEEFKAIVTEALDRGASPE